MKIRLSNPMSAVVWAAFLTPAALGPSAGPWLAGAVLLLGALVLYSKPSPWEARGPSRTAAWFFFLIQTALFVSYMFALAFKGIQTGPRDALELARPLLMGVFTVYLLRHFDAHSRAAVETALTAALYASWFLHPAPEFAYMAVLALCHALFVSRSALRYWHAGAAVVLLALSGQVTALSAAVNAVAAFGAARAYTFLAGRGRWYAAPLALGVFAALLLALTAAGRLAAPLASVVAQPADALAWFRRSPVLGWGPAAYEGPGRAAHQYALWLARSGAVGMTLIAAGLVWGAYRLLDGARRSGAERLAGAAAFLGAVGMLLGASPYWESYRLFFVTGFCAEAMRGEGA